VAVGVTMLIINADDWGRSKAETDAALDCFREGRVTSVTAMMFMKDSERAAELAKTHGVDAGLHLNLNQAYDGQATAAAKEQHHRVAGFLNRSKFAILLYHPGLRNDFREVFRVQMDEFERLYGKPPTHVDGHQHRHLCANMLFDGIIPAGLKVRRSFTFWPGEKGPINRAYRGMVDGLLRRRYRITDFFFSLEKCLRDQTIARVFEMAVNGSVELMTHPVRADEYSFLLGEGSSNVFKSIRAASYVTL
jgi:predicted glycoside hydrolase/deacetylase ChbG (UPF0249 family)